MKTLPLCQSCAMPMANPDDFGTNAGDSPSQDYCVYCFKEGSFTSPETTFDKMVETVAGFLEMPETEGRKAAREALVGLKRWQ